MAVDQRNSEGESLGHSHERVIDCPVAVGVQLSHDFASYTSRLHVAAIWAQTHFAHLVDDASMHRLEAITSVRQRASVNNRVAVFEKRVLHLSGQVDVENLLGWLLFASH